MTMQIKHLCKILMMTFRLEMIFLKINIHRFHKELIMIHDIN
jgi:hypothetical protein